MKITANSIGGIDIQIKKFNVGDVLIMKKAHACNKKAVRFEILMLGSDIKIRCIECGREVVVPRIKLEKRIKSIQINSEE